VVIYDVLTESPTQHPWAKYYSERGISRPVVADVVRPARRAPKASSPARAAVAGPISSELAAAVAAVNAEVSSTPGSTTSFLSPRQREIALREAKRQARWRSVRFVAMAAAGLVCLHFAVTRFFCRAPSEDAVAAHLQSLPETLLPYFSTARQPLQADGVTITQADQIDAQHIRYVATVTLRLRKPLYVGAVTNGTAQYRRLQEAVQRAQAQESRLKLFTDTETPDAPSLPMLLQRSHQEGETVVVRVPFIARRFGWQWRLEEPQLGLRVANRVLEGDSLDRYGDAPYLIFGGPATLAEVRRRTKIANNYVLAVAKEVQRHADGEAIAETAPAHPIADRAATVALADLPAQPAGAEQVLDASLADQPAQPADTSSADLANVEARPAIDPNAPAVFLAPSLKYFSAPPRTVVR